MLDANKQYPMLLQGNTKNKHIVHLNKVINHPKIQIGDFTYWHNFVIPKDYASTLAPFLFPFSEDKLIIGKFVQIADGVTFITNSANHNLEGFSTYPFPIFLMDEATSEQDIKNLTKKSTIKKNIYVGNDVWIGYNATIMPGVSISDGAVIGANSVVTKDVDPYTIVAGNPAKKIKKRFNDTTIMTLLKLKWWDWNIETIEKNKTLIMDNNIKDLKSLYKNLEYKL